MGSKNLELLEVRAGEGDVVAAVPLGVVEGDSTGRTLAVVGGVHGTEYAAQDAVARFWDELDPRAVSGRILVVLMADPIAFERKSAYVNPVDGKNLNRMWPGESTGSITAAIAAHITEHVVTGADALVDVHGGEWDEAIGTFIITHATGNADVDQRCLDLAVASGFPYIEVTDAEGPILGRGTGSGEACRAGVPALTFEAGGEGEREARYVQAHLEGLRNVARHLGILAGPLTTWAGAPVVLDHGVLMKVTSGGVLEPVVQVGDYVQAGEPFTRVLSITGQVLETLCAPEAGTVLDVITSRAIAPGGFAGKIGVCPERTTSR